MSLDASGKPVVLAKPAKAAASAPSKLKASSSTSQSLPSQKQKGTASGNKSTAASQKPALAKGAKARLTPLTIPTGIAWFGSMCMQTVVESYTMNCIQTYVLQQLLQQAGRLLNMRATYVVCLMHTK